MPRGASPCDESKAARTCRMRHTAGATSSHSGVVSAPARNAGRTDRPAPSPAALRQHAQVEDVVDGQRALAWRSVRRSGPACCERCRGGLCASMSPELRPHPSIDARREEDIHRRPRLYLRASAGEPGEGQRRDMPSRRSSRRHGGQRAVRLAPANTLTASAASASADDTAIATAPRPTHGARGWRHGMLGLIWSRTISQEGAPTGKRYYSSGISPFEHLQQAVEAFASGASAASASKAR